MTQTKHVKGTSEEYPSLHDYGLIGDLRTVALVGPRASVEMMCFPSFDSPSIFAAHVDRKKGGCFYITPKLKDANEIKQYFPDTNILLSRFLSDEGIAEVSDFMYLRDNDTRQALVRRAKAVHQAVEFEMRCAPRFDYGRKGHEISEEDGAIVFVPDGNGTRLRLRSSQTLEIDDDDAVVRFRLEPGQSAIFVLEDANEDTEHSPLDFSSAAFKDTLNYWRTWSSKCEYQGHWRHVVLRSALALKLLVSREHGAIVAAPTFGFPNDIGGERNWDYRNVWIRDASFTIFALLRLGYTDEAKGFMSWIQDRIEELKEGCDLQTMYRIDGSPVQGEFHLDHFEGYKQSQPVRVGSENHDQLQLDIYGEILDAVYLYDKHGETISYDFWKSLKLLIKYVEDNWQKPDTSIWEVRGGAREFLYSRVMCWVAVDRAVRLANKRSLPAPIEHWRKVRDQIYTSVFDEFWDEEKGAFVQFKGGKTLDAAALIMPLVRFLSPTDPRWTRTLSAIQEELAEDTLVYRYKVNEAFPEKLEGKDGTFTICSFWMIECISRSGDLQKARYMFEKMLSYSNHLGLFSEQISSRGEPLGNMPQAFSHLALISAAYDLDRRLKDQSPKVSGSAR